MLFAVQYSKKRQVICGVTHRLIELAVRGAWSQPTCKLCTECAEICRGMLCWVQCKAVLGAEQSCPGRPAGAEVMLKSSLTVSVVGEAPKDARLHTRSCTYTEKVH